MSEPASHILVLLAKKLAEKARQGQWYQKCVEWFGFEDTVVTEPRPYTDEDELVKKGSYEWLLHRMRPANKIAWTILLLAVVVVWFNLDELMPDIPRLPYPLFALILGWLFLRWLSRDVLKPEDPLAWRFKMQARGMFWWSLVYSVYALITFIPLWVNLYLF